MESCDRNCSNREEPMAWRKGALSGNVQGTDLLQLEDANSF
jgi:hypothetical protein